MASSNLSFLFVCTGNICRSPIADGVLREKLRQKGWGDHIRVDSAGTHGYHVGSHPDPRAQKVARAHGYDIADLRARKINSQDFEAFDYILFMDDANEQWLMEYCPNEYQDKLHYLMAFAGLGFASVEDPYYGDEADFEKALNMIEKACDQIIERLDARS